MGSYFLVETKNKGFEIFKLSDSGATKSYIDHFSPNPHTQKEYPFHSDSIPSALALIAAAASVLWAEL